MDFTPFDKRHYQTRSIEAGYDEWALTYESTVLDLMDIALFERLKTPDWSGARRIIDLACGTGRVGSWIRARGTSAIDGVDLTPGMLAKAEAKGVYDSLHIGDVANTGLAGGGYSIVTMSLADEHLADLTPAYREAARLLTADGQFVLVGYYSHFLMAAGMPTHFDNAHGEPIAIESHVHLISDHVAAAFAAGFELTEMLEGLIDDAWIASKPKWAKFRSHPVSFALVWKKKK